MEVSVLLLEQQSKLRVDQRVEPVREGEESDGRGHCELSEVDRTGQAAVH